MDPDVNYKSSDNRNYNNYTNENDTDEDNTDEDNIDEDNIDENNIDEDNIDQDDDTDTEDEENGIRKIFKNKIFVIVLVLSLIIVIIIAAVASYFIAGKSKIAVKKKPSEFPFIVKILESNCTGSLLNYNLVLTTASCLLDTNLEEYSNLTIVAGTSDYTGKHKGSTLKANTLSVQNLYKENRKHPNIRYNIGIITLTDYFVRSESIRRIKFGVIDRPESITDQITVVGWTYIDGKPFLKSEKYHIGVHIPCKKYLRRHGIREVAFCTDGSWEGDAGSAAIVEYQGEKLIFGFAGDPNDIESQFFNMAGFMNFLNEHEGSINKVDITDL